MCEPRHDDYRANDGHGEIAFGALQAGLDLGYSGASIVFFTWQGFDEMDEVTGDGSAELLDDGSIEIEFAYHNGDEAILKASRMHFFNSLLEPQSMGLTRAHAFVDKLPSQSRSAMNQAPRIEAEAKPARRSAASSHVRRRCRRRAWSAAARRSSCSR